MRLCTIPQRFGHFRLPTAGNHPLLTLILLPRHIVCVAEEGWIAVDVEELIGADSVEMIAVVSEQTIVAVAWLLIGVVAGESIDAVAEVLIGVVAGESMDAVAEA